MTHEFFVDNIRKFERNVNPLYAPLEFLYPVSGKRMAFIPKEKPTMNSCEELMKIANGP